MAFKPLTVVSIAEFKVRSEELVREVYETGEPLFIMDGDVMLGRLLPPDAPLSEIEHNLRILDETHQIVEEQRRLAEDTGTDVPDRRDG